MNLSDTLNLVFSKRGKGGSGFANFASIGIQLGGIGSIAPERKKDLANLVTKAMFGGALASWLTATIAGILI